MEPQFQLQLSGCINQQNPVKQNPLSISCLRAIDYAVLIFFTVFMLSGLFLFVFRIVNKKVSLTAFGIRFLPILQIGMVPELSDDFSFKIKKRRKQNYQWASDDAMSDVKVQLHSVQEKETGRVVPKGLCVLLIQS